MPPPPPERTVPATPGIPIASGQFQAQAPLSYDSPYYQPPSTQPAAAAQPAPAKTYGFGVAQVQDPDEAPKPKKELPDPSLFAPPPIRADRVGPPSTKSATSATSPSPTQLPATTSGSKLSVGTAPPSAPPRASSAEQTTAPSEVKEEPKLPSKTNLMDFDISKFGAPPPKIYRGPQDALPLKKSSANASASTVSSSFTPPPPPPARVSPSPLPQAYSEQPVKPPKPPKPTKPTKPKTLEMEDIPPPRPARADSTEATPPPMPARKHDIVEMETPPPKPSRPVITVDLKKAPPPTPSRKAGVATDRPTPPPPYLEVSPHPETSNSPVPPRTPNFAAEIAKRNGHSASPQPEPIQKKAAPPPVSKKPLSLLTHDAKEEEHVSLRNPSAKGAFIEQLQSQLQATHVGEIPHKVPPPVHSKLGPKPFEKNAPVKELEPIEKAKPAVKPKPAVQPKSVVLPVVPSVHSVVPVIPAPAVIPSVPAPRSTAPEVSAVPPPPPTRNYVRSKAPIPVAHPSNEPPQLDLEMYSGWYADVNGPINFPEALAGLNNQSSMLYSTSGGITNYERRISLRLKDLSSIRYVIKWSSNNVAGATVKIDKFIPSPISSNIPSKEELVGYLQQYGEHVASWCEHRYGQQVGRGECWDLAKEALEKGCGKHAFVSEYYHHGYPILLVRGVNGIMQLIDDKQPLDEVRRGDILQFKSCTFYNAASGRTQTVGAPDHTSVVLGNVGGKILVAEQNVNNVRTVQNGEYILRDLTLGDVCAYRPVPASWAGSL